MLIWSSWMPPSGIGSHRNGRHLDETLTLDLLAYHFTIMVYSDYIYF